jgi:hypothetical protein
LPKSTAHVDDIHRQGLLGFYKPPSLREQPEADAEAPLRSRKEPKAVPKDGLFGR